MTNVESIIRQAQKNQGSTQVGGARAAGDPNRYPGQAPTPNIQDRDPRNPNNYTISLLPWGRFEIGGGLTSFTVTPKCGVFLATSLFISTDIAATNILVSSVTVGVKEFLQISTTSGVAPVLQAVQSRTFVETGVNVFFETTSITSVCPVTISVVVLGLVDGATVPFSGCFLGFWANCPWGSPNFCGTP